MCTCILLPQGCPVAFPEDPLPSFLSILAVPIKYLVVPLVVVNGGAVGIEMTAACDAFFHSVADVDLIVVHAVGAEDVPVAVVTIGDVVLHGDGLVVDRVDAILQQRVQLYHGMMSFFF